MEDYTPLIVQGIVFVVGLFKVYSDMQVKFKEIEVRLAAVERRDMEIRQDIKEVLETLKKLEIQIIKQKNHE
jgi:hypothetical protein